MLQRNRFLLEAIAIIVIAGVIGVIIAFYGRIIGTSETTTPIVINEVYPAYTVKDPPTHQWVELYNRTKDWQTLKGWSLESNARIRLPLPEITLPPRGYAIVAASTDQFMVDHGQFPGRVVSPAVPWTELKHHSDYLLLRDGQGRVQDVLNWGYMVDTPPEGIPLWDSPPFALGVGWLLPPNPSGENFDVPSLEELDFTKGWIVEGVMQEGNILYRVARVANDHSLERRPVGTDHDTPGDFVRQPWPSPGTVNAPSGTRAAQLLLVEWTNVASYAGGIILWIAFVYIAMVARRFEALTQQRTFWQAMLVAPAGILIYNVIQAYGFLARGSMTQGEQWTGFLILFFSAIGCTVLVYIFRQRAQRILEG